MTSDWKEYKLKDLITIKHGYAFKGNYISAKDNGVVLVTPGNFAISGGFQETKCKFYTSDYPKDYILKENDLIVTMTDLSKEGDTLGYSAKIPKSRRTYLHNQRIGLVESKSPEIDKEFLYWYMRTKNYQKSIVNSCSGSVIKHTSPGRICDLEILLPPIKTQQKIAKALSAIDNKIELNNKINENLEQQMNNLFLDFVSKNAKIEYTVEDIALTANTGADAIQKAPIVDYNTGIKCVRVGDITNNRSIFDWGYTKITDTIFKQYQLKKDDIIITRTACLGLNKLITKDLQAIYNNGLIRITINKQKVLPLFLYRQFQTKDFYCFINRIEAETSVRPNMKINYLLSYPFKCPNIEQQKSLIIILEPMLKQEEQLNFENQYLSQLRDTLLPKLMNGEINVEKVEL